MEGGESDDACAACASLAAELASANYDTYRRRGVCEGL